MVDGESPATGDPFADRGGKSVQDFSPEGVLPAVRRSLALLLPRRRRLFVLAAVVQVSLGLLDLLGIVLVGVLATVAVSGTGLASIPVPVQSILDLLGLGGLTVSQLSVLVAGAAVVVLVAKTGLSALMSRRIFRFLANRQAEVSARLAREFLSRPLLDVQRWTTSEAVYALGSGVGAAVVVVLGSAVTIAAELFLFLIVGISLLYYDLILTLVALVLFAVIILSMNRFLTRWGARNAQIMTDSSIQTLSAVSEALETYREATVLHRRDLYVSRYEALIGRYAVATANQSYIMEIPKYVLEATLYLAVLVLAVVQFLTKDLGAAASTVAVFLAAGSRVVPALLRLQGAYIGIRNGSVTALPTYYLADFLAHRRKQEGRKMPDRTTVESASAIRERIARGHGDFSPTVEVRGASVTYLGASLPALEDADLDVAPGTSVALVGSTGAGKSTLTDVILGVLEPDTGSVTISGVAPREAISRWPGAISYVPQQVALVFGTVRDNVALGLPPEAVDDALVWEALERARIADFLRDSREGLDTLIGERGVRLSGGQRQRLGIARALYTRPLLLVLDEATSALDAETEQAIVNTLNDLEGEVTTITVAHRLATVRRADQLLYLRHGQIECRGTFEEVRAQVPDFDRQASLLGL
ncbi:MAG: ATP-binding cassette domain-containing protein [Actinomycetales bacterium]|nr:ATP-binding cassette domain-containing protein [Actinomycetales bacterium]